MKTSMKKLSPSLLAASMIAAPAVAEVDVYGKVNLTLNRVNIEVAPGYDPDNVDNLQVISNASRIGFKADKELTEDFKAIGKIEYEVAADGDLFGANRDSVFKARNVYVGLEGDWGQFIAGRTDTPLKQLSKHVDVFNDYYLADVKEAFQGENRVSNMIQYTAPDMNGFGAKIMAIAGEAQGEDDPLTPEDESELNGFNGISSTVGYKAENWGVGVGMESDVDDRDLIRLAGKVSFGDITLGGMLQSSEIHDENRIDGGAPLGQADETGFAASVAWKMNAWKFKAQYAASETDVGAADDEEITQMSIGVDYKLDDDFKIFGYGTNIDTDDGVTSGEYNTAAVGFEFKF